MTNLLKMVVISGAAENQRLAGVYASMTAFFGILLWAGVGARELVNACAGAYADILGFAVMLSLKGIKTLIINEGLMTTCGFWSSFLGGVRIWKVLNGRNLTQ